MLANLNKANQQAEQTFAAQQKYYEAQERAHHNKLRQRIKVNSIFTQGS